MSKPGVAVEVCNLSMSMLKISTIITSIEPPDEGSLPAIQCAQWWDVARQETLRASTWGFARRRFILTSDSAVFPAFGWAYRYQLPSDYIRVVSVGDEGSELTEAEDYVLEDGYLLTNTAGQLPMLYIYDHQNPSYWPADFMTTMASNLAKWVGPPLSAADGNTRLAEGRADKGMAGARRVNGQENKPKRVEFSRLLARRRRSYGGRLQVK